ncbi:MAG TPA: recombinase [Candidatus Cloacimonetes bacterium]|nr:recombinase [Candidatus Cloacimonadota bacterium]
MNDKEYKEWEAKVEKIEKENKLLLSDFEEWLKTKKLKSKTIKNHLLNIDFYINSFLLHYEAETPVEGIIHIGLFLGDYFIRKASWSSKYTIQENIASFKKFYTYLNEIGKIDDDDLEGMKEFIKDEKKFWLEEVESYQNDADWDL